MLIHLHKQARTTPKLRIGDATMPVGAGAASDGARVDVGIRPEHLSWATADAGQIAPVVEVFEPLGSDTMAICRFAGHELAARLAPDIVLRRNQPIHLGYDLAALHYFDVKSGQRLDVG